MSPLRRRILYAVLFESLGLVVATTTLVLLAHAPASTSALLAALTAIIALVWNLTFNAVFESWEARQTIRGRSQRRRIGHAVLFEAGLMVLTTPVLAWGIGTGLVQAIFYDLSLTLVFMVYTYLFTLAFDLTFGLPASAR